MKYLIWTLIILAVVVWLKRAKNSVIGKAGQADDPRARPTSAAGRRAAPPAIEQIVQCSYCDLHFPASEAVRGADGKVYCGEEHRRLAA